DRGRGPRDRSDALDLVIQRAEPALDDQAPSRTIAQLGLDALDRGLAGVEQQWNHPLAKDELYVVVVRPEGGDVQPEVRTDVELGPQLEAVHLFVGEGHGHEAGRWRVVARVEAARLE